MNAWQEEHEMLTSHLKELDEYLKYHIVSPELAILKLRAIRRRQEQELENLHNKWEKEGR